MLSDLLGLGDELLEQGEVDGLRTLNGVAERTVPDVLRQSADGAGNAEEHGVEVGLGEAIVVKHAAGVGVDVGPGVLGLAVLGEHVRNNLVDEGHELEQLVVGHVLLSEDALGGVAGVRLAEDGVAEAGDDLTRVESVPSELAHGVLVEALAGVDELLLRAQSPVKHLLVGETVERARETGHTGREGEVGVRERGAHKADGVRGNVATLVVGVDGEVETHVLVEGVLGLLLVDPALHRGLAPSAEADHAVERGGHVERGVGVGGGAVAVRVVVDHGGDLGELGDDVEGVLERGAPVVLLVDGVVLLSEDRVGLERGNGGDELGHGVGLLGEGRDDVLEVGGDLGALVEVLAEELNLGLGGDLTGHEVPEGRLGEGLALRESGARNAGESGLELGDGLATVADTLVGVKDGSLPEHALNTAHATGELADGDGVDDLLAVGLVEGGELLAALGDHLGHARLEQVGVARGRGHHGGLDGLGHADSVLQHIGFYYNKRMGGRNKDGNVGEVSVYVVTDGFRGIQ